MENQKRSYGFGVSGGVGSEQRSVVRFCGETRRLLEQLKPKVSTCLCMYVLQPNYVSLRQGVCGSQHNNNSG